MAGHGSHFPSLNSFAWSFSCLLLSCEGKFQVPFLTSFYFPEKWASKAIQADMDLRQMAPACGLSVAIQR